MAGSRDESARAVAARILRGFDPRRGRLAALGSDTGETQRCTDLVRGVLRWQGVLDTVLTCCGGRPVRAIEAGPLAVLRVALYELLLCPQTPVHALVHEAVACAKRRGGARRGAFVNALLRRIQGHVVTRRDRTEALPVRRRIEQDATHACALDVDLWPDPDAGLGPFLGAAYNLPAALVATWLTALGPESTAAVCRACQRRPGVTLRSNPTRCSGAALLAALTEAGVRAEVLDSGLIRLHSAGAVTRLPGYDQGWFSVQDPCAAAVAPRLNPRPGERILDLCAAPGGKTTHLAELSGGCVEIWATDRDAERLERVRENVARLGSTGVHVVALDAVLAGRHGAFDAILLDVPCSNTGVLARRLEVRYRLRLDRLASLLDEQAGLLSHALGLLAPGGRIVYSTCSIQPEENTGQVRRFLAAHAECRCVAEHQTLPACEPWDHDGGYTAILTPSP